MMIPTCLTTRGEIISSTVVKRYTDYGDLQSGSVSLETRVGMSKFDGTIHTTGGRFVYRLFYREKYASLARQIVPLLFRNSSRVNVWSFEMKPHSVHVTGEHLTRVMGLKPFECWILSDPFSEDSQPTFV
jgi:hypothetical protein